MAAAAAAAAARLFDFGAPKFFFRAGILVFALFFTVNSDDTCDLEIQNTLRTLLTPQEFPSVQLQALRRHLLRKLTEGLRETAIEEEANSPGKRNLEALARAGYVRTLPTKNDDDDPDKSDKRSLGRQTVLEDPDSKRGIQSLARNGELHGRRDETQELLDELYAKRNLESLARNYNFPSYGKRYLGSLMRNGDFQYGGKRNIASLAREGGRFAGKRTADDEKRNIASIKAQYRNKREADYYDVYSGEYPSPVYQNQNVDDYEDLMNALTEAYPNADKRFLGSVAKTGWFRPTSRFRSPDKRHIGALARLGWLPTLRNVRRFNRSGRSTSWESCRTSPADGQAEDDVVSENSLSLGDKRFLLQPAVDRILLRKMFMHPRTHTFLSDMS